MTSISVQGMNVTAACRSIVEFEQLAQSILTRFKLWLSPAGYGSWHTSTERLKKGRCHAQLVILWDSLLTLIDAHTSSPAPSRKDMFQLHHNQSASSEFRPRPLATGLKQDNNSSSSTMEPRKIVLQGSVQAEIKYTTKSLQVTLQWCLRFHLHTLAFVPALGDGWVGFAARQTMSRIIPEFLADKIVGSVMDNRYVRGFLLYQSLDILPGPWLTLFAGVG
ncbi:hypothetical protein B0H13DRAFT_1886445 [Mycena leptocephala]|nr:hypothetical protein B0H13DRAFT_1886445 [Mycena leptocephala]